MATFHFKPCNRNELTTLQRIQCMHEIYNAVTNTFGLSALDIQFDESIGGVQGRAMHSEACDDRFNEIPVVVEPIPDEEPPLSRGLFK